MNYLRISGKEKTFERKYEKHNKVTNLFSVAQM